MPRFGWKRAKHSVITLADRARDVGQWELAAEYYRDALHRKPKNPPIWVQYGHVLKESGHLAEAESAYRTALTYDQRLADAHLQLGLVLKIQGKKEEAWEACLRALALDPSLATEAALRAEFEERAANEAQLRLEIEQRALAEAALRAELEQRAANEAQLRLEIEQGALAEAALRAALAQAEHGVQERAAAEEKLQAELDLVRGALAMDVRSPETGGETMVAPPPPSAPAPSAPAPPTSIVSPADCGVVPAQPIIGESVGRTTLIIDASGLFDEKWYLLSNPEVKEAGTNPLRHYVEFGWKEGRDPHPLFDTDWYLERRPDVKEAGVNPLRHFVESGWTEGSDPNPLFDTDWYLEENPDVGVSGTIPLLHYLRYGAVEGRNPHPLFDTNFYVQQNVDVRYAGINPLTHYLIFSGTQRHRPSPIFDADWYLKQNRDVAAAQVNPLLHYLYSGATEGRNPNPFFDTKWYCINNPEVATADINPLVHYVRFGAAQGRDPHPQFSTSHYLADNPDVAAAGINPLAHYLTSGAGRFPFLVEHSEQMLYKPSFLILIETHTGGLISETVISLENQIYPHWRAYLIHSYAWDDAKNLPEGEFLIPIRAGDILSPEALYEFANALNVCPDWDMVYADEDRMLTYDRRGEPFYKPDWSPDYLETFNYVGYPACFRRNVAEGCSLGYGYYGFVLRFTEKTKQISHIRKILCHRSYKSLRRTVMEETLEAHALAARLQRTGRNGEVIPIGNPPLGWELRVKLRSCPLVSIVIPTAGKIVSHDGRHLDLITNCVSQIRERSTYRNFEIILVDNDDISPPRKMSLSRLNCKFVTYRDPVFNISKKLNLGALKATGDFLLLLNDDIEIITQEWIERMLGHFEKDHVGVVGVKLLYPDGRIQHAGVVHSLGNPDHVRRGVSRYDRGYFLSTCGVRNFAAVTGACMMVRTEVYRSVSGYTEALAVSFNDVDFCQKVRAAGFSIVYTPHVELIHFESQSHEVWLDPNDWSYYHARWAPELTFDPFYNERNLSLAPPTFDPVSNKRLV